MQIINLHHVDACQVARLLHFCHGVVSWQNVIGTSARAIVACPFSRANLRMHGSNARTESGRMKANCNVISKNGFWINKSISRISRTKLFELKIELPTNWFRFWLQQISPTYLFEMLVNWQVQCNWFKLYLFYNDYKQARGTYINAFVGTECGVTGGP